MFNFKNMFIQSRLGAILAAVFLCSPIYALAETSNVQVANQYLDEGNSYKALYYYQLALSHDKRSTEALYGIASIEHQKGQHKNALSRLNTLRDINPDHIEMLILRARIYTLQSRWEKALKDLKAAEVLDTESTEVQLALDNVYTSMGDNVAARKTLDRYNELNKLKAERRKRQEQ